MADLRESGAIEQDADIVLLLHRPEYYDPNDQPGIAELIVAKNRNGATDTVKLTFLKNLTRFENLATVAEPVDEGAARSESGHRFCPDDGPTTARRGGQGSLGASQSGRVPGLREEMPRAERTAAGSTGRPFAGGQVEQSRRRRRARAESWRSRPIVAGDAEVAERGADGVVADPHATGHLLGPVEPAQYGSAASRPDQRRRALARRV